MNVEKIIDDAEIELKEEFAKIDKLTYQNSKKVISAFHKNQISENHFNSTTGYGYGDVGRDAIESVFAEILGAEDALVRNQFISGSHALTVAFFGLLRPNDKMLSITGEPYDTLKSVIGITPNASSLKSFNVEYQQIDLKNDDFDDDEIIDKISVEKFKLIHIQRSRGYSQRKSLTIDKLERIIKKIRDVDKNVIIMVDNCYCEMVNELEPCEVGADIVVGSLIKNLGGGIAPNGAYIAGKKELVNLCAERLTVPGEGKEVGPTLGINRDILKGLFLAPNAVGSSLKLAILTSYILEKLGYEVSPKYNETRADIVEMITFRDREKLIKFVQGIQAGSAIDAHAMPEPSPMPGYNHDIIMASGSFIQGSSIETSCDGPIKEPYIAYMQGSLTYEYGKIALIEAIKNIGA